MKSFNINKFALAAGTVIVMAASHAVAAPAFTYDPTGSGAPPISAAAFQADQLSFLSTELIYFNADGSATAKGYASTSLFDGSTQVYGYPGTASLYIEFTIKTSTPTVDSTGAHYTVNSLDFSLYTAAYGSVGYAKADSTTGMFVPGTGSPTYDQYGVSLTSGSTLLLSGSIASVNSALDYANITGSPTPNAVDLHSMETLTYVNANYFVAPSPFYPLAFDSFTNNPGNYSQSTLMSGAVVGAVNANAGNASFSNVPEPSTVALFGIALVGMGVAARRRKS